MSPHPSPVDKSPIHPWVAGEDLVFGEDPRSLALPIQVVAQIWVQVHQGMRTLARGGLEVGGLLVGPKASGRAVVDSIIPLPIEYRHGPSLQMSSSDLANIVPAIESVQGDVSKAVVGFYRSRTRGDGTLRESDHEIFNAIERAHTSFAADFRCCFVVAPKSESAAFVCISMRNGDGWEDMQPFTLRSDLLFGSDLLSNSTVPSSTGLLQMPRRPDPDKEESSIGSPVSLSALQPVTDHHPVLEEDAASLAVGRRDVRRARAWLYAAACLALAGGVTGVYRWAVRKPPQPTASVRTQTDVPRTHLGFSATLEGSVWKLAWDRAAMDTLNPIAAVLSIEDGGSAQQVPLAPADLASGTIFYTPQTKDLAFRLRIDRGGEQIEEHVRVLGAPRMTQPPFDRVLQPVPTKAPLPVRPDTGGVTLPIGRAPIAVAPVAVPGTADPKPSSSIPTTVTPKEPTIASTSDREAKSDPAPVPPSTAVAIAIPVPPTVEPRANLAPPAAPAAKPTPDVAPVRAPVEQQAVRVPAAAGAASPSASAKAAVTRDANEVKEGARGLVPIPPAATPNAPAIANYVGPKPIQQVRPQSPAKMPSGVSQVQVLVEIDSRGKVVKVTPIGLTAANAPLMIPAEQAASFWIFDPARLNGHAVPSQMNLTFQFQ